MIQEFYPVPPFMQIVVYISNANVGRGHDPADHGSIMYTKIPAMDALFVIFRSKNCSVVGGVMTPPYIAYSKLVR